MNNGIKILIVDDSKFQRRLLAPQLKEEGYIVDEAENGFEALIYLGKSNKLPDLILTDLFMPRVDGFQLCSKVKELYPDIPVIIHTANSTEEHLKKAFSLGASDYLGKPFTLTEMNIRLANIINLKKAEKEILKSKRELEDIFNTAADWMRVIDFDYNVIRVNDALAEKLGQNKDRLVGMKCYEMLPGFNCSSDDCTILRMKRSLKKFEIDVIKQVNKIDCSCILKATPFTDENGKVIGVVENIKNITDRKTAEQALKNSEAKYRGLIDFTKTGYLILDNTGKVIDANQEYVRLTGYKTLDEIKGRSVLDWTADYDLQRNKQEVEKCIERENIGGLEIDYVHMDGSIINIEVFAKVVVVNGKQQILSLCRDITSRNKRIAELKVFKELLGSSNDAIFIINFDNSKFYEVNTQACISLGYTKKELLNLRVTDVSEKISDYHSWKSYSPVFKEKIDSIFEDTHIRKDGSVFPVEVSVKYLSYSSNEYFIAIARDISERIQIEDKVRNLAKLPHENSHPMFRVSINGDILYSNPAGRVLILDRLHNNSIANEWLKVVEKAKTVKDEVSIELHIDDKFFIFYISPIINTDYSNIYGIDHTEREVARKTILEVQKRLDLALKGANVGLWDWNVKSGEVFYDDIWCNMIGYTRDELKQHVSTWKSLLHPDDEVLALNELHKHFADSSYRFSAEFRLKTKSGEWKWILGKGEVLERDKNGEPVRMLGIHLDISERLNMEEKIKLSNRELQKLVFYDTLTNVINRKAFLDLLAKSIKIHKRQDKILALLFVDVDKFKSINDLYGHDVGDKVLQYIAQVIKESTRESDFVGRMGGDEFVICLKDIGFLKNAVKVAKKINTKLIQRVKIDSIKLDVGVSIGIASYPNDGDNAFSLLKNSDLAMYKSKKNGQNNFFIFNREIADEVELEYELEFALENNEYSIEYQKIYDANALPCCAEALLRWESKRLGTVMPGDFIHILEKNKSFVNVGNWVIEEVCKKMENTVDCPHVSINLSYSQLETPSFYDDVVRIMSKYKIDPGRISFEITEKNKIANADAVKKVLEKLKKTDICSIIIDDFGVGNSSFLSLINLPVDVVKIDQYLIHKLNEDKYYKNVSALVKYMKELQLKVVAEGVETQEQFELLKKVGCDYFQGYYFSKPEKDL